MTSLQPSTWGDYLQATLPNLLEEYIDKDVSFRKGLPVDFLRNSEFPQVDLNNILTFLHFFNYEMID